ncbi:MAG: hypothetical protein ABI538_15275 [Pseudoxanthomonas sp.]
MFKLLGVLLAVYTLYAAAKGEVVAKAGPGARTVLRSESPRYFWCVIILYAGLALALAFIF